MDRVHDGVWIVELAPVTADVEIVPAMLAALGLREAALLERAGLPRDGLDRLLDMLADRETILLLDNCEHLIAAAADMAEAAGRCPRLRIVATSREPLADRGREPRAARRRWTRDAALAPFADRAAPSRPASLDADVVRRDLPPPRRPPARIELAAARLRTVPVEELAGRLDDRFRLLTGGSRTALRATGRCARSSTGARTCSRTRAPAGAPAGRVHRRATEERATAVTGEPTLDGLAALVDKSLLQVVQTDPTRYRMLETIREYGLEKLDDAGEAEAARTAHARWFAALAERRRTGARRATARGSPGSTRARRRDRGAAPAGRRRRRPRRALAGGRPAVVLELSGARTRPSWLEFAPPCPARPTPPTCCRRRRERHGGSRRARVEPGQIASSELSELVEAFR